MKIDYNTLNMVRDDVLLSLEPLQKVSNSVIFFKEDPDNSNSTLQYFRVLRAGTECKHVKVGDVVVGDWKRITPPFSLGGIEKYGITSEKEILAVVDTV